MEPTRDQLQAEVLEILYQKSLNRPTWVSCPEVYWNIQNTKVSERSVKEVLDWLVKNDLVLHQADKYQIDKREFLDMSRRKENMEVETSKIPDISAEEKKGALYHSDNLCTQTLQPHNNSNATFAIIALIALLLSGTFIGILVFNGFSRQIYQPSELVSLSDSIRIENIKVIEPGYIKEAYGVNRNFKAIYNSLAAQRDINEEILSAEKSQRLQINQLVETIELQSKQIDAIERERTIYTWITACVLLILSLLLVCRFGRRH